MRFPSISRRKRSLAGALLAVLLASTAAACSSAAAPASSGKQSITLAVLDDPTRQAALWALENHKVSTGSLAVKITLLSAQSAQVAYQSHQYDVVEASPVAVAAGLERGLVTKILSGGIADRGATVLYVRSSSTAGSVAGLKGRRIAISSTQGSSTVLLQFVLSKKYGVNSALTGGAVTYQVAPPDETPAMLQQGQVNAAVELNAPAYQLHRLRGFQVMDDLTNDARDLLGAYPLQTVLVTYPSVEQAKAPELKELVAALRASTDYVRSHQQQVAAALSTGTQNLQGYFAYWWQTSDMRYGDLTAADVSGVEAAWTMAVAVGQLPSAPAFADIRSPQAPTS